MNATRSRLTRLSARPSVRLSALPCALALVGLLVSCGGDDGNRQPNGATTTDSAGIEIVMNPAPVWAPGEGWRVADEPSVTIGAAAGDEAYTLYGVRDAIRLPDGRIAVANSGTRQIRIYDEAGRHLEDLGREGQGPGEFMLLMDVWLGPGDSIVAADNRLARLTFFDAQGRLGRTIPLQQGESPRQLFGRATLDDGSLLVSGATPPSEQPRVGLFDGGVREFDRYAADGRRLNSIGALPHGLNWGFDSGNPYGPSYTSAPFAIFSPPHATDGETVYLGDGTRPEVRQWSPDGALVRIVRWGVDPVPVTPEVEDRYRTERTEDATTPDERRMALASVEGLVFPDHLPVYQELRTDSEGHLWVKAYEPGPDTDAPSWVFDPAGRWLGAVRMPPGLTVLDVGADYVLGSTRDAQDVERVVLYGLDRG